IGETTLNQLIEIGTPTSTEESTDWIPVTQRVLFDPKITMGFRYDIIDIEYDIVNIDIVVAYARATFLVNLLFSLNLPVDITVEYPEQMTVGKDYTWYATLTPIDDPQIKEFECKLGGGIEVAAGIFVLVWVEYSEFFGPYIDKSLDFVTPVGPGDSFPIGDFEVTVWDFWLMSVDLVFEPLLTSQKITADVNCGGDSSGSHTLTWTDGGQKIPFTVHAEDYDPTTDSATIQLSDFRYYFTDFELILKLKFDFDPWIDWLTGDPTIKLFTLDLDWLIGEAYVGVHQGPSTVDVEVFVKKFGVFIEITPLSNDVVPGETCAYNIFIQNDGNTEDEFILSLAGLPPPPWLYGFNINSVILPAGESTNIIFSVTPYHHYSTSPGDYPFEITATSQGADSEGLTVSITESANVHVLPFYELDLFITPATTSIYPDETGEFELDVQNLGNVLDSFDIEFYAIDFNDAYRVYPTSIQEDWINIIPSTILDISAGLIGSSVLTIDAPYDWAGMEDATYEFDIKATSLGDPLAIDSESASITIKATLESRLYYINLELHWLKDIVSSSTIEQSVKDGLLDKLEAAINKKEQAHQNVFDGRLDLVDNKLETIKNIMEAFIRLVLAQINKDIPPDFAFELLIMASETIEDIENTILYLLTSILGVNTSPTASNSLQKVFYYNLAYIMTGIVLNAGLYGIIMVFLRKKNQF
ncbi:MAG: hypothetical protein ACFFG0_38340, partial [Candidatus Thorarchaeota archaeon]